MCDKEESEDTPRKMGDNEESDNNPDTMGDTEETEDIPHKKDGKEESEGITHVTPGIHRSRTTTLGVFGLLVALVYMVYTSWPAWHQHHPDTTWRPKELKPLPETFADLTQLPVRLGSSEIIFTVGEEETVTVFYREALPTEGATVAPSVVLLHGAGDSSLRWQDLGTMHLTAAMGHRTIAVDLPGWGETKTQWVSDHAAFLQALMAELGVVRPVFVTASASGSYVIPYLMQPRSSSCHERAAGLVTIAPTSTGRFTPSQYHQCEIPAMLAYGVTDRGLGLSSVGNLRNLPHSEIFPVDGAGHAMQFEQPHKWHQLLYNFLITIK